MMEQNELSKATRISTEEYDLLESLLEDEGFDLSSTRSILARNNHGDPPLSFAQQRLWFLDQLRPNNPAYNIPAAIRLSGNLNVAALERTINEIVRRHEVLRAIFVTAAGQPRQVITDHQPRAFEVIDLSRSLHAEREVEAHARAEAEARRPFDLSRGPLLRAELMRLAEDEHILLLTMHHIVSDGWSAGVLVREVAALYEAYAEGRESPLAELPIQYADYAQWQQEWLKGPVLDEQLGYWRGQLAGAPPLLELPTDRPRPAIRSFRGGRVSFGLGAELSKELESLSRREGATLFMTLLTAWQALLSRYSGQTDICVGTPIAGRTRSEVEGLIGFFVNMLVVRGDLSGDPPFTTALRRVKDACLGAYAHQDAPFEKLVEELRPERSLTQTPLFQVCFVLQNVSIPSLNLQDLKLSPFDMESVTAKFDLTLILNGRNGALEGEIEYSSDLFNAATVRGMLESFRALIDGVADKPERRISQLQLLSEVERWELLIERNKRIKDELPLACLDERLERQAALRPESVAVACEGELLTYRELNRKANQLARRLRTLGVGSERRVALLMERSVEMVVALLATLKAGGAYVPLDPLYPQERLEWMLVDSGASVLLTQRELRDLLPETAAQVVEVDVEWGRISGWSVENLERVTEAGNLAYIIYTSGSTGRPKGVMVTHGNVARLLRATRRWYEFCERDVWTLFHSYAFDFSVWELWGALLHGGRLEVAPFWVSRAPESFYELLEAKGVTVLNQTPSAFRQLTRIAEARAAEEKNAGPEKRLSLRYVIFGGEALDIQSLEGWMKWHGDQRPQLIKTGDLARYLADGDLEYAGRADNQVKIRGFRIELGEIEATLMEHACVREAIVSVREDFPGEKRLVAYLAPREGREVDGAELRGHLMERLPDYMAPSACVMMEELPLTPNGKIDRRALPAPGAIRDSLESARVSPRDALELELSHIWEDILRVNPIGVRENFFELGGYSLLAVSLMERVSHLTKKQIPLATIFQAATIERMANLLREQTPSVPASSLVEIQKGNLHPPLFFIHPSGGNVFSYVDLARLLGPEQPFYGLQAQGLDGEQEVHTRIEEMAAHYLGLIRTVQPKGPYQLGGWSLGGLVAFEMAQRLWARNEHVELVALVDSYVSVAGEDTESFDRRDLYAQFIQHLNLPLSGFFEVKEEFCRLAEDEQLTYVLERIMAADERYMRLGLKRVRHLFRVFEIQTQAARQYAPKSYAGRVALFRAADAANGHQKSTEIWTTVASGGLDFHLVPGDHYTILHRPNVEVLAYQLRAHLHHQS